MKSLISIIFFSFIRFALEILLIGIYNTLYFDSKILFVATLIIGQ